MNPPRNAADSLARQAQMSAAGVLADWLTACLEIGVLHHRIEEIAFEAVAQPVAVSGEDRLFLFEIDLLGDVVEGLAASRRWFDLLLNVLDEGDQRVEISVVVLHLAVTGNECREVIALDAAKHTNPQLWIARGAERVWPHHDIACDHDFLLR